MRFCFYVFFGGILDSAVPDYRCIGRSAPRLSSVKLFPHTLMGSLLMLVAMVYLHYQTRGSFSIVDFQNIKQIPLGVQQLLFGVRPCHCCKSADVP